MKAVLEEERRLLVISQSEAERLSGPAARRLPGGRPHHAGLSLHGRYDSEETSGRDAGGDCRSGAKYGLRCANVFHAGDGNLHLLIAYDANQPGELRACHRLRRRDSRTVGQAGGTVTGEHRVGVEKIDVMAAQFTPAEIVAFHRLKAAFDGRAA